MADFKGYLMLVLHAHLPFVRHPEHEDFLEEDWLYEAITETYIPLINVYENLIRENIDFRITMSITPPLVNMLSDKLLMSRYKKHLAKLIELSEKEVIRTSFLPHFHRVAKMYEGKLKLAMKIFNDDYHDNLLFAFKKFQDMGKLEIITCGATHGFLPLMLNDSVVKAQIHVAKNDYRKHFGKNPQGIWLAECAYQPGHDKYLKEAGIKFFFMDTHGVLFASPRPKYGIFAPIYTPARIAAFARDVESSQQVWSAQTGYPGDYNYREFYRDIGYDLDYEYIKPYLHQDGVKRNIGLKYYKITGRTSLDRKEPYDPYRALETAANHAGNFMFNREKQIEYLYDFLDKKPCLVSPYDAELFGHWWYEGPDFINYLFRKIHYDQKTIKLITPSEYLNENPKNQVTQPTMSTWGDKGYNEVWLNGTNDWIYRHLHKISDLMVEMSKTYKNASGLKRRALNQAARELLLAQSSDWAFIMTTGTMVAYAEKITKDCIHNFLKLEEEIRNNNIDENYLSNIENRNNLFPEIDYNIYSN